MGGWLIPFLTMSVFIVASEATRDTHASPVSEATAREEGSRPVATSHFSQVPNLDGVLGVISTAGVVVTIFVGLLGILAFLRKRSREKFRSRLTSALSDPGVLDLIGRWGGFAKRNKLESEFEKRFRSCLSSALSDAQLLHHIGRAGSFVTREQFDSEFERNLRAAMADETTQDSLLSALTLASARRSAQDTRSFLQQVRKKGGKEAHPQKAARQTKAVDPSFKRR